MAKKQKTVPISERALEKELNKSDFLFGPYLRAVRKALNISIRTLAKEVDKTPTYISDIENRNNKPPEKELLEKMVVALNIDKYYSPNLKNTLFDLAAKERNEVSCDIKDYIMGDNKVITLIRKLKDAPNNREIVEKLLNNVSTEVI
ncbi:MAG: helix-turn-helix transcriptional regulator [Oscillospiraceae bacterium]|nr:helix-turn-helix transcriptional regulator [Oscillospiraceae bacterium]